MDQSSNSSLSSKSSTDTSQSGKKGSVVLTIIHLDGKRTVVDVDETQTKTFRDIFHKYQLDPTQYTIRSGSKEFTNLDTHFTDLPVPKTYKGIQLKKKVTIEEKVVGGGQ